MIKSVIISTIDGMIIYKKNISINPDYEDLIISMYQAHRLTSEVHNDNKRVELGDTKTPSRYVIKFDKGVPSFEDRLGEHVFVSSFEDEDLNLFGFFSFCNEKYYNLRYKIFNLFKGEICTKHLYEGRGNKVFIDDNLIDSLDGLVEDLNNKNSDFFKEVI